MIRAAFFLIVLQTFFLTACKPYNTATPVDFAIPYDAGILISDTGYSEMAYLSRIDKNTLISTITVSKQQEGASDQTVGVIRSTDNGKTWGEIKLIEPYEGPEASWAMPWFDGTRLWVFYTYNNRNVRERPIKGGGHSNRVDIIGDIAYRSSSDGGVTWGDRQIFAIPRTKIDDDNGFTPEETVFWLSGEPAMHDGNVYLGLSKSAQSIPNNILPRTEAFILKIRNIEDQSTWELMPSSDGIGFIGPENSVISEEPTLMSVSKTDMYVSFRTLTGQLARAYSKDNGMTWDIDWARHLDGTVIKNPRAKPKVFKMKNGKILLWFHNNNAKSFYPRHQAWLSCGTKTDGDVRWGEPKQVIYSLDPKDSISYPSFLDNGKELWITVSDKKQARLFKLKSKHIC